ncbi:CAAX protease family protein [Paenibacillus selenitireducens]|uniref:CAAX protease family protein n=1 Tax=Paenibacillus selenitireducens TaxID=1324314 RepID=A0A1T2XNF4_9BACL|nr:type II CAAX endopeptidase family protein [Paenibacillus selenitireducens]OPA81409.1 CAAX protease family protein [Paenibacillus selenitireducens]
MKKINFKRFKLRQVSAAELNDRLLLINLYITQGLTLIIGLLWVIFQRRNPLTLFQWPEGFEFIYWAVGLSVLVLSADLLMGRFVPEEAMDDGGINDMLFRKRPIWHIVVISAIVAICEELLFRGAIQYAFGPYWTSILFAVIHVRYLRHWVPTGIVFAISYGLGFIYIQTGTLWAPIITHFIVDLVLGLIIRFRRD